MSYVHIIEKLKKGESVTLHPAGNSMRPKIKSKDRVVLSPLARDPEVGDIVLAKVSGKHYIHLVTAIDGERIQISNNHGHVNGWTRRDKVFGIVTEIGEPDGTE